MDSLLLEWWLIHEDIVKEPTSWRQDFIVDNRHIDAKEIRGNHWSVKPDSLRRLQQSISYGVLTDFLFYETERSSGSLLKEGDTVKFKFINLLGSKKVMNMLYDSQYGGKYFPKAGLHLMDTMI
jgi:hypothetical protein